MRSYTQAWDIGQAFGKIEAHGPAAGPWDGVGRGENFLWPLELNQVGEAMTDHHGPNYLGP
jgi:hypothetical protein